MRVGLSSCRVRHSAPARGELESIARRARVDREAGSSRARAGTVWRRPDRRTTATVLRRRQIGSPVSGAAVTGCGRRLGVIQAVQGMVTSFLGPGVRSRGHRAGALKRHASVWGDR